MSSKKISCILVCVEASLNGTVKYMKRVLYFPDYKCSGFGFRVESLVSCHCGTGVVSGNYKVQKVIYPPYWHTDLAFYTADKNIEQRFVLEFDIGALADVLYFIRSPERSFDYLDQSGVKFVEIEQPKRPQQAAMDFSGDDAEVCEVSQGESLPDEVKKIFNDENQIWLVE